MSVSLSNAFPRSSTSSVPLLDLSATWRGHQAGWQLGCFWTRTFAEKKATIVQQQDTTKKTLRVGVLAAAGSLTWLFSWTLGDVTLRVPILLDSSSKAASGSTEGSLWWYSVSALYLSFLSVTIQNIVSEVLLAPPLALETFERQQLQERRIRREKARKDALQQQGFMERQARSRTEMEKERNGLVIRKAVYRVVNGDSLDVTIPLQFWVVDSTLVLFQSVQRKHMLGFYDVAAPDDSPTTLAKTQKSDSYKISTVVESTAREESDWWKKFVERLLGGVSAGEKETHAENEKPASIQAQLLVQYDYAGRSYEVVVLDDEEDIALPNERATLISS
jgi:hypothetical protein